MNIFEKMLAITAEMAVVEKGLTVKVCNGGYKAVSERDELDAVKPLEQKYGVYSYPFSREIAETGELTSGDRKSLFMRVVVVYRFVNTEKPDEYVEITTYGDGIDTGDKAPGKAMTYADKYALLKAYKISTGDDPDADPSPEKGYKKTSSKKATNTQIAFLAARYTGDKLTELLQKKGVSSLEEMPIEVASDLIKRIKDYEGRADK